MSRARHNTSSYCVSVDCYTLANIRQKHHTLPHAQDSAHLAHCLRCVTSQYYPITSISWRGVYFKLSGTFTHYLRCRSALIPSTPAPPPRLAPRRLPCSPPHPDPIPGDAPPVPHGAGRRSPAALSPASPAVIGPRSASGGDRGGDGAAAGAQPAAIIIPVREAARSCGTGTSSDGGGGVRHVLWDTVSP